MELKKRFLIVALLIFNILNLYSQEISDQLYEVEISNPSIKNLVSEIESHLSEISDDKNFIINEDFELVLNSIERYETKADEVSGKKVLQGEIFYKDKKKDIYLLVRKYCYNDGHYILSFSYVQHNRKELTLEYIWNDSEERYELCN